MGACVTVAKIGPAGATNDIRCRKRQRPARSVLVTRSQSLGTALTGDKLTFSTRLEVG
jgi:hypothetical protein